MRVSLPSPTVASVGKFGDVPVNLHSGLPDVTAALFTAKGRTLELAIALRYHGGGIRVEEMGGWVGLGWTLEAGGAITRTVRGLVDESGAGYYHSGHTFYQPGNWPPTTDIIDRIARDELLDGEPDQFFFSFLGRSGQFVMGPTDTSSTVQEIRAIPYQKLDIQPIFSGTTLIEKWEIRTEDGTIYTFAARETNTDFNLTSPGDEIPAHYGESYTSSWHLTEVRSPGGDVITLQYSPYTARHRLNTYIERFDYRVSSGAEECVPRQFETINEYEISAQQLHSITSATHTIRFIADTTLRADALSPTGTRQEPRLARIVVTTPAGRVLRTFHFNHDPPGNRLRLKNVYEQASSGDSLPPYTFTYDAQAFPDRTSKAQDHWGYWNGEPNQTLIPWATSPAGVFLEGADRRPNPAKMKVGSLTRITYPTGGFTEFVWEANDYGGIGSNDAMPRGFAPPQSDLLIAQDFDGLKTKNITIGGTDSALVEISASISPTDCGEQIGCPWVELRPDGEFFAGSGTKTKKLAPGTYTMRASSELDGGFARIDVTWSEGGPAPKKTAGGLRIAEVRTGDGMGNVQVRKYDYTRRSDPSRSSGVVSAEPRHDYSYSSSTCSYFSRSSMSKMPLGSGPPVSYTEVTVLHGLNGESGKTRATFRSVLDQPDDTPIYEKWPYSRVTTYEWKRGQRVETAEYNSASQLQRRETATYSFQDAEPTTRRRFRGISLNAFSAGQAGPAYVYNPFEVISAWSYQASDTTYTYDESGTSAVSMARKYVYGNPEHVQLTELVETNADSTQRITRMKYPADYPPAPGSTDPMAAALTAMQGTAHMHNAIIERWVVEKVGATEKVVRAELTTFKEYLGRYLPYQRFLLNAPSPIQ